MLFLRYYLWIAPHLMLGGFLWLFLRRRLGKRFPWFLGYVLFEQFSFLTSVLATVLVAWDPKHSLTPLPVDIGLGIGDQHADKHGSDL